MYAEHSDVLLTTFTIILQTELRCSKLYIQILRKLMLYLVAASQRTGYISSLEKGAITPKHVGGLMNYTIVYVVCECLGLTKKKV